MLIAFAIFIFKFEDFSPPFALKSWGVVRIGQNILHDKVFPVANLRKSTNFSSVSPMKEGARF